jgi:cell division protein FtsA
VSKKEQIVSGLDIGTTKICMLIGRVSEDKKIEIISTGYSHSRGLKKGIVVDMEETAASIRKAATEAELKSGISVDWVTVGVSGDHVQSLNCHGAIPIEGKHNEISAEDVAQVVNAARSVPVPPDREVIHVLPQEFFLDNRGNIRNPIGLSGSRLDVNVHVVTCEAFLIQNLVNAVNRAQMRVNRVILQQLASAKAVLTPDEKDLGAALIDIGGGTTDIAIFSRNAILCTSVLPVGGDHFTRDLAVGLRTPTQDAEQIKKDFGTVLVDSFAPDEIIEVPGVGTRSSRGIPRQAICQILRDRAVEVLELIKNQIEHTGHREQLTAGVVLTGGGSLLEGMLELAEDTFELPVRPGLPQGVAGLTDDLTHPVYATAIGLAMFGAQENGGRGRHHSKASALPWALNRFLSWVGN